MRNIIKVIEWMLPDNAAQNRKNTSYVRATSWGLFFSFNLQIIYIFLFFISDFTVGYSVNLIGLAFTFIGVYYLKRTEFSSVASNIIAFNIFSSTVTNSYFTGGLYSSILLWVMLIPIISMFILDRKHGFFWVTATLIALALFFMFSPKGSPNPITLVKNKDFDLWVNLFILTAVIWLSALVLNDSKNKAIEEANDAKKQSKNYADALESELIERIQIENALRESKERLKSLADTDELTKLINRRRFFELAEKEFKRSQRYALPLSIALFDIDDFKAVNDQYGHLVGDQALFLIATTCSALVRSTDILARYGGEEFVILFPHTDNEDPVLSAERIRAKIDTESFEIKGQMIRLTLSVGVASYIKGETKNVDILMDRADKALYQAKREGKNKVRVWKD